MVKLKMGLTGTARTVAIATVFGLTAASTGLGNQIDLTQNNDTTIYNVAASLGGPGKVGNFTSHPTGTGVFDPFLTIQRAGGGTSEQGYNTAGHVAMYMDQQRPTWNTLLQRNELATINLGGSDFYMFELDSNEPGGNKKNILITDVQIFTSVGDLTVSSGGTLAGLVSAGATKRWDMSDTILLNSTVDVANGGSGFSDMMLYVPVSAFAAAGVNDYIWFYNLNGSVDQVGDGFTEAGFEEWRAVRGPSVPDGGSTMVLLGLAASALGLVRRHKLLIKS